MEIQTEIDTLKKEIGVASINTFISHHKRGALFEITDEISLEEVGYKISIDDSLSVSLWLQNKILCKVSDSDIEIYKAENNIYSFLIIQPYVLIQKVRKNKII